MSDLIDKILLLRDEQGSIDVSELGHVLTLDYYDGPESGLVVAPSGHLFVLKSLGDSRSRWFRAFELLLPSQRCDEDIRRILRGQGGEVGSQQHTLMTSPGWPVEQIRSAIESVAAMRRFVGIGSPQVLNLEIFSLSEDRLNELREANLSVSIFAMAHRMLKNARKKNKQQKKGDGGN